MFNELIGGRRESAVDHLLKGDWKIRKLTPKECFRLQGWEDDYFEKAQQFNSDSQLYKQAGNGVTVNVIKAIAEKL
jgi:DNA (cytosine-5)-methyltransferase 1